jgi:NAD(P)-dependent dehydrogenase (short-subunit alcohol dehydrogenase family)
VSEDAVAGWANVRFDYRGATVLVTGGTGRIGAAVARSFLAAGADVIVTGTRPSLSDYDDVDQACDYRQLDVEDRDAIDRLALAIPKLDILVNSAGLALFTLGLNEYEPDNFDRAVGMHLTSVYRLAARLAPRLAESALPGGASIISMASMSSLFGIDPVPGYGAGKTGLLGLTRVLAVHWASRNIRVNALAVGMTRSRMTSGVLENAEITAAMLARVPLGRHGEPVDVAGATLFLSSAAASWITGQTLAIDGGFSISG